MAEASATEEMAPAQEADDGAEAVDVQEAELPDSEPGTVPSGGGQLDILLDTAMEVSVCLGQAELPARELIQLGPGSVLRLNKRAGEPVDLLLRGIPFAQGRLVVVGEQLAVKIEEILPPPETGAADSRR